MKKIKDNVKSLGHLLYWFYLFSKNAKNNGLINKCEFNNLKNKENLVILCNGPSLKDCEKEINSYERSDYLCVNFYPINSPNFDSLKPKFICLIDPDFYSLEIDGKCERLNQKLESVNWAMYLFNFQHQTLALNNKNIREIKINHNVCYDKVTKLICKFYDLNMACMPMNNVAVLALFAAIKMGYNNVYIYGLDMSFHKEIAVDDNNHIIKEEEHFYGSNRIDFSITNSIVKENGIKYLFKEWYLNFYSFDLLRQYANYKNINILNCTPGSYVDAFVRKKNFI